MQTYFTHTDNFLEIIRQHLPNVQEQSVEYIKTGWTNIVVCASDGEASYFFRFPRNRFFAKMMLKDHSFCTFLRGKVSFRLPNLQLFYDQDRPFSMHKKIQGWTLTERFKFLSRQAITNLAYDIAQFLKELEQIDPKTLPPTCNMYVSKFLDELATVSTEPYDFSKHDVLRQLEQNPQVVHGDFNPGNILLDASDRMIGVIDFAFSGVSGPGVDLSRVIGRTNPQFQQPLLEAYEAVTRKKCSPKCLQSIIPIWNYVEQHYIQYIRENHPEIQLPS